MTMTKGRGKFSVFSFQFFRLGLVARHRVVAVATPGVATADAAEAQPGSFEGTVGFQGIEEILGAGRIVAAACARAGKGVQRG